MTDVLQRGGHDLGHRQREDGVAVLAQGSVQLVLKVDLFAYLGQEVCLAERPRRSDVPFRLLRDDGLRPLVPDAEVFAGLSGRFFSPSQWPSAS